MTRKLFRLGGLDVTAGKLAAAGVVIAAGLAGTCAVRSCSYDDGRNSVVSSDAMINIDHGTIKASVKRQDMDNGGNVIGSTEYSVIVSPNEKTQELGIQRNNGQSVTYTDSSLLDDEARRMDGRVDKIYFPALGVTLERSHDYVTNTAVFTDANAELEAARARFGRMY